MVRPRCVLTDIRHRRHSQTTSQLMDHREFCLSRSAQQPLETKQTQRARILTHENTHAFATPDGYEGNQAARHFTRERIAFRRLCQTGQSVLAEMNEKQCERIHCRERIICAFFAGGILRGGVDRESTVLRVMLAVVIHKSPACHPAEASATAPAQRACRSSK